MFDGKSKTSRGTIVEYVKRVAIKANRLGEALWSPLYANPERPVNSARFLFLDPGSHDLYPDWERIASETVAIMRQTAGADRNHNRNHFRHRH